MSGLSAILQARLPSWYAFRQYNARVRRQVNSGEVGQ